MREKVGTWAGGLESGQSEQGDLRLQLEGGLEVLEAASGRYRELASAVQSRGWKKKLRLDPTLLEATFTGEGVVPEVLARLRRRVEREPEGGGPASRLLREFEEEREKLSRAIGRRLSLREEAPLVDRLVRLKAVVLKPLPLPPGPGETVLLEGSSLLPPLSVTAVFLFLFWNAARLGAMIMVVLFVLTCIYFFLRSGHYWLTSERLVWQPRIGEPVQVLLSSLGEGQLARGLFGRVKVGRLTLRNVPHASKLAALLSIRRRKEFRDAAVPGAQQGTTAVLSMYLTKPGEVPDLEATSSGLVVLRPGFIAYFSESHEGARILQDITESPGALSPPWARPRERVSVSLSLLLEQLQLLPEERMDALLRKAAAVDPKGFVWERKEMKWSLAGSKLELSRGDKALWSTVDSWKENQLLLQALRIWESSA